MDFDTSQIQYLHDSSGQTTAVRVPIHEWQWIESNLGIVTDIEVPEWQKK